jgi:hypothetical protein
MRLLSPFLPIAASLPFIAAGLWLWRDQGALVWLSGVIAYCF